MFCFNVCRGKFRLVYSFRARIDGRSLVGALGLQLALERRGQSAHCSKRRRRHPNDNEVGGAHDDSDDEAGQDCDGDDDEEDEDDDGDDDHDERDANRTGSRGMSILSDLAAALTYTGCAHCGTELRGDSNGIYRCARTECAVEHTAGAQPSRYETKHDSHMVVEFHCVSCL